MTAVGAHGDERALTVDVTVDATVDAAIAAAYSATGAGWRDGPERVYRGLADELLARSPVPVRGARVVDIGTGTGAAARAAHRAGARSVVAIDAALGMLAVDAHRRPPAVAADATRLPFAAGAFDVAVAAFSFNHLAQPAGGFVEAARAVRRGGAVVASAYADDDHHPVKDAAERALRRRGWTPAAWYSEMHAARAPLLASRAACVAALAGTGLDAHVDHVSVDLSHLGPRDLVEWRFGMAQCAPFVAALRDDDRELAVVEVLEAMGDPCPPLVRSMIVVTVRC